MDNGISQLVAAVQPLGELWAGGVGALSGMLLGSAGFWAWMRKKEERPLSRAQEANTVVSVSRAVVEMQHEVMDQMRDELQRLEAEATSRIAERRKQFERDMTEMREKINKLEKANEALTEEVTEVKRHNALLEQANQELSRQNRELIKRLDAKLDRSAQ